VNNWVCFKEDIGRPPQLIFFGAVKSVAKEKRLLKKIKSLLYSMAVVSNYWSEIGRKRENKNFPNQKSFLIFLASSSPINCPKPRRHRRAKCFIFFLYVFLGMGCTYFGCCLFKGFEVTSGV